jgi:aminoglycoside phosphotransferase (APT) family kinase protein
MAQRIAALHSVQVSCARSAGVDDLIAKLRAVTPIVARCRPSCRETLRSVVDRLLAQAGTVPSLPLATLHGDLHLKNFVIDDNQVAVIDLDNVCTGSPFQDLGSLIAGLHYLRALCRTSGQSLREPVESFLRAYERNVRWPVPRPLVSWYVAAALITERAYRCVTRLKAGRLDLIDDLIAIADRISAEADGRS